MLVILAMHYFILSTLFDLPRDITIYDSVFSTVILTFSIWGIILLVRAYPTIVAITVYALFVALFVSSVTVFAQYEVLKLWLHEPAYEQYRTWLSSTLPVRFLAVWIFCTWVGTISAFRKNLAALDSRFQQQVDASALLKEAELFKLRQQLQPHFLYNSLNSINALIMIAPGRAQEMIGKLSDFLRSSVKRESDDMIPIADELSYIRSYLAIESVRFGDRLQVLFQQQDTDHASVPPFLLQPLLENAIKFGLYGNTGAVQIAVNIAMNGGMLQLSITNPYDPDMQPPRGTGFGLKGVQRRLYLLYARNDLLETHKDGSIFTTILKIPQQYVQSNTDRR
ncbi:histidine kinase [Nemorincola caseinilytica]|uniref:Histidine kinase n=2 Tax=Nemorincola caseinilytica TaxID=2054315 RepID=A0ABP8NIF0_9BACT